MNHRRMHAALALSCLLNACSFAPVYRVPQSTPMPPDYKESAGWVATRPADDLPKGDWWIMFEDSQLDALENKARRANQSLKAGFGAAGAGPGGHAHCPCRPFSEHFSHGVGGARAGIAQFADLRCRRSDRGQRPRSS